MAGLCQAQPPAQGPEVTNPIYSLGSSGVPYANSKGIGYLAGFPMGYTAAAPAFSLNIYPGAHPTFQTGTLLTAHSPTPVTHPPTPPLCQCMQPQECLPTAVCPLPGHPTDTCRWSCVVTSWRVHSWCCRPRVSNQDFLLYAIVCMLSHSVVSDSLQPYGL